MGRVQANVFIVNIKFEKDLDVPRGISETHFLFFMYFFCKMRFTYSRNFASGLSMVLQTQLTCWEVSFVHCMRCIMKKHKS
jgi:hypothetical protein